MSSGALARAANCPSGRVALTFDDGPTLGRSEAILDVLDRTRTPATFFSIGERVARNPDLALAMKQRGYVMANHTWAHLDLKSLTVDEVMASVRRTDLAFRAIGIQPLRLVRPPFLETNDAVRDALEEAGFVQILASIQSKDWSDITPEEITRRVVSRADNGSVIGLHDGVPRYEVTAVATEMIIEHLKNEGFCFGVLDGGGNVIPPRRAAATSTPLSTVGVDEMIWIEYLMGA